MVQPKPGPGDMGVEFGVPMNLPFAVPYRNDHTLEVIRSFGIDEGPTPSQLAVMRRTDGQARALYRLITLPIRSALASSTFIPEDGGQAEADFIEKMFLSPPSAGGMTVSFPRFMAQMLLALFDGFAAFEQVYWVPKIGPLKGKITLKKIAYRPTETITFLTDANGGFEGFRQRAVFAGRTTDVDIPLDTAFYYAAQEEENPFYGVSFFQSAFYHYDKKVRLYYVAHLAAQRAAVATRVGTVADGASETQRQSFTQALADLGVAQSITLPSSLWKVDVLNAGGSFDFLSYINHHNSQMSKSVLASFFDTAQGGGADTPLVTFGEQSDALFMLMLQTIMDEIAAAINTYLIPKFIDWNFGSHKYPKFQWGTFTDEEKARISDMFSKLAVSGQAMNVTHEFFREMEKEQADEMGLEIDWKAVEKREADEKAQAAAMGAGAPGGPGMPPRPPGSALGPLTPRAAVKGANPAGTQDPNAQAAQGAAGAPGALPDPSANPLTWGMTAEGFDLVTATTDLLVKIGGGQGDGS
jgi:hypothetical protein